ncbi:MAG: ribose-phosphate diphosphokinase [Pseudomonadota bacterium]
MPSDAPVLFALGASREFGERIGRALGVAPSPHEERDFEDGEHKARPLVNVRNRDVYVVHSLYGDPQQSPNDKLCRLLFFIGAVRDAAARSVTAVIPYLAYARKDRKTQPRDPVNTRYVAALLEAVGTDCVVTIDVHNLVAFQNAFRCRTEHLEARGLFADFFSPLVGASDAVVLSPDAGGVKRAERVRVALAKRLGREVPLAFMEKQRALGIVSGEALVGNVAGRTVVIIDDLISTGTTLQRAATACRNAGAAKVYAAATHGLFVPPAAERLGDPVFERVVITDTVPPFRLGPQPLGGKLAVLDTAPLFAEAIKRLQTGGSIVELMDR